MPNFVRPDKMFLQTVNKAEDCVAALTDKGQVCGALTQVHRELPRGMGTVCYTAAIDQQELQNAIRNKKTKCNIVNNNLCLITSGAGLLFFAKEPAYLKEERINVRGLKPHCDISMLNCGLPVFCVGNIARPKLKQLKFTNNESSCIVLYGALLYKESPEMISRAQAIENWGKSSNLMQFDTLREIFPPAQYAYNQFGIIAHKDVYINFSEMQFRKDDSIIQNNPFIIYADWDRIVSSEVLHDYLQQGYNRCKDSKFSKPKQTFDEIWSHEKDVYFTREELLEIKAKIDAHNQGKY